MPRRAVKRRQAGTAPGPPQQASEDAPGLGPASVLAFIGAAGAGTLAIGHAGVAIPVVSALGPGGSDPVWPAAAAFTVAALAFVVVGVGLRGARTWAVPAASILFGVTVIASLFPFRGVGSIAGAVVGIAGLALLSLTALRRWNAWTGRGRAERPGR